MAANTSYDVERRTLNFYFNPTAKISKWNCPLSLACGSFGRRRAVIDHLNSKVHCCTNTYSQMNCLICGAVSSDVIFFESMHKCFISGFENDQDDSDEDNVSSLVEVDNPIKSENLASKSETEEQPFTDFEISAPENYKHLVQTVAVKIEVCPQLVRTETRPECSSDDQTIDQDEEHEQCPPAERNEITTECSADDKPNYQDTEREEYPSAPQSMIKFKYSDDQNSDQDEECNEPGTSSQTAEETLKKNFAKLNRTKRKLELKERKQAQPKHKDDDVKLVHKPEENTTDVTLFQKSNTASTAQKRFVERELQKLQLLPSMKVISAEAPKKNDLHLESPWRTPPEPFTQPLKTGEQVKREDYTLHPVYVLDPDFWRRQDREDLPCRTGRADLLRKPHPLRKSTPTGDLCPGKVEKSRKPGELRLVVGRTGPFYLYSPFLQCDICGSQRQWQMHSYTYLQCLPDHLDILIPFIVTPHKAVSKDIVRDLCQGKRAMLNFSRVHNDLLLADYQRRKTIYTMQARKDLILPTFLDFEDREGFAGEKLGVKALKNLLLNEYKKQKPFLEKFLKGLRGRVLKVDGTFAVAKKVKRLSGARALTSAMNEHHQVISSVLVPREKTEQDHIDFFVGLAKRYFDADADPPQLIYVDELCCNTSSKEIEVATEHRDGKKWQSWVNDDGMPDFCLTDEMRKQYSRKNCPILKAFRDLTRVVLDAWHGMDRLLKTVQSKSHPLFGEFATMLSNAFFVYLQSDVDQLTLAIPQNANLSKRLLRRHCRTFIPQPEELEMRILAVLRLYFPLHSGDVPLFTEKTFREWTKLRIHVRKGCLSDPRHAGPLYLQVKTVKVGNANLPLYTTARGSTQLEGFHRLVNEWITGHRVSPAVWQAQFMLYLGRHNYDQMRKQYIELPCMFDAKELTIANRVHKERTKFPLYEPIEKLVNEQDSDEIFGVEYLFKQQKKTRRVDDDIDEEIEIYDETREDSDDGSEDKSDDESNEDEILSHDFISLERKLAINEDITQTRITRSLEELRSEIANPLRSMVMDSELANVNLSKRKTPGHFAFAMKGSDDTIFKSKNVREFVQNAMNERVVNDPVLNTHNLIEHVRGIFEKECKARNPKNEKFHPWYMGDSSLKFVQSVYQEIYKVFPRTAGQAGTNLTKERQKQLAEPIRVAQPTATPLEKGNLVPKTKQTRPKSWTLEMEIIIKRLIATGGGKHLITDVYTDYHREQRKRNPNNVTTNSFRKITHSDLAEFHNAEEKANKCCESISHSLDAVQDYKRVDNVLSRPRTFGTTTEQKRILPAASTPQFFQPILIGVEGTQHHYGLQPPKKKQKRKAGRGSNAGGRNCLYCMQLKTSHPHTQYHKAKKSNYTDTERIIISNLPHGVSYPKVTAQFDYCAKQMSDNYEGATPDMTLREFQRTPHFKEFMDEKVALNQQSLEQAAFFSSQRGPTDGSSPCI